jgi:hypothetical protein
MSALEQDILNRLMQLDHTARLRVIRAAEQMSAEPAAAPESWAIWLRETRRLRDSLQDQYGTLNIDVTALVREVRDEES